MGAMVARPPSRRALKCQSTPGKKDTNRWEGCMVGAMTYEPVVAHGDAKASEDALGGGDNEGVATEWTNQTPISETTSGAKMMVVDSQLMRPRSGSSERSLSLMHLVLALSKWAPLLESNSISSAAASRPDSIAVATNSIVFIAAIAAERVPLGVARCGPRSCACDESTGLRCAHNQKVTSLDAANRQY
jgi:hypothetical protein